MNPEPTRNENLLNAAREAGANVAHEATAHAAREAASRIVREAMADNHVDATAGN